MTPVTFWTAERCTSMDRETERALVEGLRHGDESAFEAVHAAFNQPLFTFLVRMSRSRQVAEDLLEETWLRLVKHAVRLQPDTRLGAWLYTVARHLSVSYFRSRVLEDSLVAGSIALWPYTPRPASPFDSTAASELERRLERALAAMPAPAREVLLLVGVSGLSPSDAADVCGITPEALRQRLSRARALLARALDEEPEPVRVLGEVTP